MADRQEFRGRADFKNTATFAGNKQALTQGEGYTTGGGDATLVSIRREGDFVETTLIVDLHGLKSQNADNDIIGKSTGDTNTDKPAYFFQWQNSVNGKFLGGQLQCLEAPGTGEVDIDVYATTTATLKFDVAKSGGHNVFTANTDLQQGSFIATSLPDSLGDSAEDLDGRYFYFAVGTASTPTAGVYDAGKVMLKFQGQAV